MVLAAEFPAIPSSAVKIASERQCAILVHSGLQDEITPTSFYSRWGGGGQKKTNKYSMPNVTGRPGYRTMEMIGGSSAPYLARTPCVLLLSTLFNRGGNRRAFRLPGAGGGSFPLYGGTFARSYSVSNVTWTALRIFLGMGGAELFIHAFLLVKKRKHINKIPRKSQDPDNPRTIPWTFCLCVLFLFIVLLVRNWESLCRLIARRLSGWNILTAMFASASWAYTQTQNPDLLFLGV